MDFREIREQFVKNWKKIALIFGIFLIGVFFRTYNFSDWLHFETDQVDDVLITEPAIENGLGKLELLGPKAGAKLLRLPPGFYYLESLSASVFGNTPFAHALPVLFFSCLSPLLFYIFSRRYFSAFISILLLVIFSYSLYLVIYSRFSWNPNILPFFMLFSLLALLRVISPNEKNKDRWLLALSALFGFSSQLHYNALFILGAIICVTLLIKRPRFNWKTWAGAFFILSLFYIPIIAHEIKTDGLNTKLFFEKISDGSKDEKTKEGPLTKLSQDFRYGAGEYFLILSGNDQINNGHLKGPSLGLSCKSCQDNLAPRAAGYIFYILGIFLLLFNLYKEKDAERKNFLMICTLWFVFSFLYFWNLLNNKLYLYPRFFLIIAPLPFIFLGLMLEKIHPEKNKVFLIVSLIIVSIISLTNISKILSYFSALEDVTNKKMKIETEDVFPNTNRATLSLHGRVVEEIKKKVTNKKTPVYLLSESEYEPVYWYLLSKEGIDFWKDLGDMIGKKKFFEEGHYFIIYRTTELEKSGFKDKIKYFDTVSEKYLGSLTFIEVRPKVEWITEQSQDPSTKEILTERCQSERILNWEDVFRNNRSAIEKTTRHCEQ